MAFGNLVVNQGTNQGILVDQAGTSDIGVVKIDLSTAGTYGTLWDGKSQGGTVDQVGSVLGIRDKIYVASMDIGTITGNVGVSSGTINVSTISSLPNIPGGSIVVTTGTVVNNGGTLNLGTVVGKDANAAAQTGNPVSIGGTDSGGTVRTIKVDSGGLQRIGLDSGTVSVLPNLPQGSINVTAGTIGTVLSVGTLPNIPGGSIVVTAGTFVNNGGSAIAYGPAAAAAAAAGNPLNVGGTDSGGTIRTIKVDSGGLQRIGLDSGTLSVLPNLPQGSINVTAGTITTGSIVVTNGTVIGNGGSMIAYGPAAAAAAASGAPLNVGGTDSGGTIRTIKVDSGGLQRIGLDSGTISVLPNLPQGSINVTAGTIGTVLSVGTLGTLSNLGSVTNLGQLYNAGTVQNQLAGTLTALQNGTITAGTINTGTITTGTINTGTINTGTINLGTFVGKDANAAAQTGNPIAFGGTDSGGTVRTVIVDSSGRLTVNSLAAGTTIGTINVGTINTGTINTGTINVGTFVMPSGTLNVGTVTSNQATGTQNVGTLNTGTINTGTFVMTLGTLATGTLSPIPTIANVTYGTHGTTGVSIFGTLAGGTGSGAGTEIFVTSLSLSIPSTGGSQDVSVGWGSNGGTFQAGTGLLVRGNFPPGGGIQKTFWPPVNSGTQAQLMMFQAGAGTADVSVTYFLAVSSL